MFLFVCFWLSWLLLSPCISSLLRHILWLIAFFSCAAIALITHTKFSRLRIIINMRAVPSFFHRSKEIPQRCPQRWAGRSRPGQLCATIFEVLDSPGLRWLKSTHATLIPGGCVFYYSCCCCCFSVFARRTSHGGGGRLPHFFSSYFHQLMQKQCRSKLILTLAARHV